MQHQRMETPRDWSRDLEADGRIRSLSLSLRSKKRPLVRVLGVTSNASQSCSLKSEKKDEKEIDRLHTISDSK